MSIDCGGCAGLGNHRRWCPEAVGQSAAFIGTLAERAGSLADSVGPNDFGAANHLWAAEALLREKAQTLAAEFKTANA